MAYVYQRQFSVQVLSFFVTCSFLSVILYRCMNPRFPVFAALTVPVPTTRTHPPLIAPYPSRPEPLVSFDPRSSAHDSTSEW